MSTTGSTDGGAATDSTDTETAVGGVTSSVEDEDGVDELVAGGIEFAGAGAEGAELAGAGVPSTESLASTFGFFDLSTTAVDGAAAFVATIDCLFDFNPAFVAVAGLTGSAGGGFDMLIRAVAGRGVPVAGEDGIAILEGAASFDTGSFDILLAAGFTGVMEGALSLEDAIVTGVGAASFVVGFLVAPIAGVGMAVVDCFTVAGGVAICAFFLPEVVFDGAACVSFLVDVDGVFGFGAAALVVFVARAGVLAAFVFAAAVDGRRTPILDFDSDGADDEAEG